MLTATAEAGNAGSGDASSGFDTGPEPAVSFLARGAVKYTRRGSTGRAHRILIAGSRLVVAVADAAGFPWTAAEDARFRFVSDDGAHESVVAWRDGIAAGRSRIFVLRDARADARYHGEILWGEERVRVFESGAVSRVLDPGDDHAVLEPPAAQE
jgi:hypothetical protein